MRDLWFLLSLLSGFAVSACEFTESAVTCPSGLGVQTQAYTGADLAAKQLVLTFNGGPSAATAAVDAVLYANAVQGSFFVGGRNVSGEDDTLSTLKAHGHLVANHTYSEAPLSGARDPEREVRQTDALLLPYITGNMFLLRGSGDANLSSDIADQLNDAGLSRYVGPIGWDIGDQGSGVVTDNSCWANGTTPADCAAGYLAGIKTKDHGIVLLHANQSNTATMLQTLIPQLVQLSYSFARLDAVPTINAALKAATGQPGTVGGAGGCSEY